MEEGSIDSGSLYVCVALCTGITRAHLMNDTVAWELQHESAHAHAIDFTGYCTVQSPECGNYLQASSRYLLYL